MTSHKLSSLLHDEICEGKHFMHYFLFLTFFFIRRELFFLQKPESNNNKRMNKNNKNNDDEEEEDKTMHLYICVFKMTDDGCVLFSKFELENGSTSFDFVRI